MLVKESKLLQYDFFVTALSFTLPRTLMCKLDSLQNVSFCKALSMHISTRNLS